MSLLFKNTNENTKKISEDTFKDLSLEELMNTICMGDTEKDRMKDIFINIPTDIETIKYRQEILKDFMTKRELREGVSDALVKMKILAESDRGGSMFGEMKSGIWQMIRFLVDLELYTDIVSQLDSIFSQNVPESEGLKEVASHIHSMAMECEASDLKEDIRKAREQMESTKSLTLGINLTPDLTAEEVFVMNFYPHRLKPSTDRIGEFVRTVKQIKAHEPPDHMMLDLTREVEKHFGAMAKKIRASLIKYTSLDGKYLYDLKDEFLFYIRVSNFGEELKENGNVICFPNLSACNYIKMNNVYNIRLALFKEPNIVKNDFSFDENGRIYILTGPNRGGKTVLTQGVGLALYMAALGIFVTADSYDGFCIERILTHFPADEEKTVSYGRLGEEAVRVRSFIKDLDSKTIILLNETYSTTCASDGLYLAKDLVRIMKERGALSIYNTHIHELGLAEDELNTFDGASKVVSIIMEILNNENTFRVLRSKPDVSSYAKNIAQKYGVTYEQMKEI